MRPSQILFAHLLTDPNGVIVQSGENVAVAVIQWLVQDVDVAISMEKMPAISSSFFNVIFRRVADHRGFEGLDRLTIVDSSPLLAGMFERSKSAVREMTADVTRETRTT